MKRAALALGLVSVLSLAGLPNAMAADNLVPERQCQLELKAYSDQYDALNKTWLDNDGSDYGIKLNFDEVMLEHQELVARVESLVVQYRDIPRDKTQILDSLKQLERDYVSVAESISKQTYKEALFERSLDGVALTLATVLANYTTAAAYCPASYKEPIEKILADLRGWQHSLEQMQSFVAAASSKRGALIQKVFHILENKYVGVFAEIAHQDLEEARRTVADALVADRLQRDIDSWLSEALLGNGMWGGATAQYYFYEEPLETMAVAMDRAETIRAAAASLSDDNPGKRAVLPRVDSHLAALRQSLDELRCGGWRGQLNLQIESAKEYLAPQAGYPQSCQDRARAFLAYASTVSSLEQFRASELFFRELFVTCG